MFNSIHKLFDYVIIDLCDDSLSTSDMQYGYKNNHSITMCTVILKEVIHHYINGNSNVYCCLLDASKAFDKIHYGKLFSTLLQRNVNVYCIRLIVDSYVRQVSRVSWGNHLSQYFELSNGVKVAYFLPFYSTFILVSYYWNYKGQVMDVTSIIYLLELYVMQMMLLYLALRLEV